MYVFFCNLKNKFCKLRAQNDVSNNTNDDSLIDPFHLSGCKSNGTETQNKMFNFNKTPMQI